MATLHIDNQIYERLQKKADERHTSVDELVTPVLEQLAKAGSTADERKLAFDQWMLLVQKRISRLPVGHVLDDSRESIYEGRGE